VIERFLLYEFFRAPGLCYDPKEDPKVDIEQQDQKVPLASVDEENQQNQEGSINHKHKDQVGAVQQLVENIAPDITQNQDPQDGDQWAEFPYMNPNHYGYRLCSAIELKSMKEEWQNMQKRRVCCTNCCC